ncbi:MAG: glycosyltransferase family 4 protein [Promethearchaeota archaeon]
MSRKYKRICYINPGINTKRPIAYIMNNLKKKEYHISIFTPRKKSELKKIFSRHYDDFKGIHLITYPVWTKSSGYSWPIPINLEFFKKCWKILKENDIVHAWVPFYPNTFMVCLIKLLFFNKKKLILTMDTIPSYSFKVSSKLDVIFKIFFKTLGKLVFTASNYITIYGRSLIKYADKAGVPKRKIKITPTGIDLIPKTPDKNIKKIFNILENEKIILFIGLHNKRKGIDLILKTAFLLKNENIKFLLIGDGPERKKSMDKALTLGLEEKILFIENRLDVHNFYGQADIFFLPSRGEGLAGVLMEAMVFQVPIVASNIAGTRDLINHFKNGLLCETENYICYARSIKKLLRDEDLRNKFIKNSLDKIQAKFLWERNIKNFEWLYQ